jgi:hypothetical protein
VTICCLFAALVSVGGRRALLTYTFVSMQYASEPLEAIRAHASKGRWILPFYHAYAVYFTVFVILEAVAQLDDETQSLLSYMSHVLGALCEFRDVMLVAFLCLPRITKYTRFAPYVVATIVLAMFLVCANATTVLPCPWCSTHYPTDAVGWLYVAEGGGSSLRAMFLSHLHVTFVGLCCLVVGVWAWWRPFVFFNPRPATTILCAFWVPLYISIGAVLPIMRHSYPNVQDGW